MIFFFVIFEFALFLLLCKFGLRGHPGWMRFNCILFFVAVVWRCSLLLFLNGLWTDYPNSDSLRYDLGANFFRQSFELSEVVTVQEMIDTVGTQNGIFYMYLVGFIYFLVESDVSMWINFNNCLLGALTIFPLYALAFRVSGQRHVAKAAVLLYTLLPSAAYWATHHLKEAFDSLAFMMVLALFLSPRTIGSYILGSLLILVVYYERSYVAYLIILAGVGAMMLGHLANHKRKFFAAAITIGITVFGVLLYNPEFYDMYFSLFVLRQELFNDGSYMAEIKSSLPLALVLPLDLLHLALTPLPFNPPQGMDSFLSAAMLFWYPLIPIVLIGLRQTLEIDTVASRSVSLMLIMGFILYAFVYAGGHYRGRDFLLPLAVIPAAVFWARKRRGNRPLETKV